MVESPRGGEAIRVASMVSLLVHATILALPNYDAGLLQSHFGEKTLHATLTRISRESTKPQDLEPTPVLHTDASEKTKLDKKLPEPFGRPDASAEKRPALPAQSSEQATDLPEAPTDSSEIWGDKSDDTLRYLPSRLLDRPPVPYSAPTPSKYLTGTSIPALPIYLRLYIDKSGKVVRIDAKTVEYMDESLLAPVKEMFFATAFIPGNIKGVDVPSYIDIELQLSEYIL